MDGRHPAEGLVHIDTRAVLLDPPQFVLCRLGRQHAFRQFEALAHYHVDDQRHEAQTGPCLDARGQSMEDLRDLNFGCLELDPRSNVC